LAPPHQNTIIVNTGKWFLMFGTPFVNYCAITKHAICKIFVKSQLYFVITTVKFVNSMRFFYLQMSDTIHAVKLL
jgi:hypothetical protein